MSSIEQLAQNLTSYLSAEQINQVCRAYYYAEQAHEGQNRQSGEHYVTHPLAVAQILSEIKLDHQTLMAAMLHDVIEDTGIPKTALERQFGQEVADMVDGVSKLTHLHFETKLQEQAENFQKMAMAMAKDIRVILVKLADRIHNMRTLGALRLEKKRRISRETLDIYAPIAARLGINDFRVELEDLCFDALYPMRAKRIKAAVKNMHGRQKDTVELVKDQITVAASELNSYCEVLGRQKHFYSIYNKMRNSKKSFRDIMDVYAFRVITACNDDCYRLLGVVHTLFKPLPSRFKDYIAVPKTNGYQSLHTTVIGKTGLPLEIQIRTQDMEAHANSGVAGHWLYKASDEVSDNLAHTKARSWIKSLMDMQKQADSPLEFIENVKGDLFPDEIYVFSPKGKILELPKGATAVDFAYAIHTNVGKQCVGCQINGKTASLSDPLQSGVTVNIKTVEGARPNPAWLNFVKTTKARSSISSYLKQLKSEESASFGKSMLETALQITNHDLSTVDPVLLKNVIDEAGFDTLDQLLEDIGLGNRMPYIVAAKLVQNDSNHIHEHTDHSMKIKGTEGLLISYAKCCRPIPGDHILGVISIGKGMVIHRANCNNLHDVRHDNERCLHLSWDKEMGGEFIVRLQMDVANHRGVLAQVASQVAMAEANIESITMEERDASTSRLFINVSIEGRIHMARVIKRLRNLRTVQRIHRVKN